MGAAKKSAFALNFLSFERPSYLHADTRAGLQTQKGWKKKKKEEKAISVSVKAERSVILFQADSDSVWSGLFTILAQQIAVMRKKLSYIEIEGGNFQAILASLTRGQCLDG